MEITGSGQTVTITNISSVTDSYYYTTCSSAGCTAATPTTASTLVSGTITATPPEQVCAISARAAPYNNPVSAATCANYISPNATYVGSGQCSSASGTATCTISSLSIPSGDIIVVGMDGGGSGGTNTLTVADSNRIRQLYDCGNRNHKRLVLAHGDVQGGSHDHFNHLHQESPQQRWELPLCLLFTGNTHWRARSIHWAGSAEHNELVKRQHVGPSRSIRTAGRKLVLFYKQRPHQHANRRQHAADYL